MSVLSVDIHDSVRAPRPFIPKGYPLLGILPKIRRDRLDFFVKLSRDFGDVIQYDIGFNKVFMFNHPAYVKHVLQDNARNYTKSKFYSPLSPILGSGIFMSEGEEWRWQRQMAAKGFRGPCFKPMAMQMTAAISEMLDRWEAFGDQPLDVAREMNRLTLDIVLRSLLSVPLAGEDKQIYPALATMLRDAERRVWSMFSLPRWAPTPHNLKCGRSLEILHTVVNRIIAGRRADRTNHDDLLSILIDGYGERANREEAERLLRHQVLSFILAGHETTANALSWTWYLLSRNPAVTRKLKTEIDDVLVGRPPAIGDLSKLTYSKMVLDEALRLYPPVWTISRSAREDDVMDGLVIPRGATVMLCAYAIHRREDFWPNPEGFDPDRFAPGTEDTRPRYAYFPFGGGPRTCLGNRFAVMEAQLAIAMIMQRYRLELLPGQVIEPEPMITLRPRKAILMRLRAA